VEENNLFLKLDGIYSINNFTKPHVYTKDLIVRLYEKHCTRSKDAWLPLDYIVVTTCHDFNWEVILSHSLNRMI
jgi:hypothetical protein